MDAEPAVVSPQEAEEFLLALANRQCTVWDEAKSDDTRFAFTRGGPCGEPASHTLRVVDQDQQNRMIEYHFAVCAEHERPLTPAPPRPAGYWIQLEAQVDMLSQSHQVNATYTAALHEQQMAVINLHRNNRGDCSVCRDDKGVRLPFPCESVRLLTGPPVQP